MNIFNGQFRDVAASATYPFSGESLMAYGRVRIPSALFLDAVVYPLGAYSVPFHVSKLAPGSDETLILTLADYNRTVIGTALLDGDTDTAYVVDGYDSTIGVMVYDPTVLPILLGQLGGRFLDLPPNIAELAASTCFAMRSTGLVHVSGNDGTKTGTVNIVAATGVVFTATSPEGVSSSSSSSETEDPVISIHLYGEEPYSTAPISRIRVVNDTDGVCCDDMVDLPETFDIIVPDPVILPYPGGDPTSVPAIPQAQIRILTEDKIRILTLKEL